MENKPIVKLQHIHVGGIVLHAGVHGASTYPPATRSANAHLAGHCGEGEPCGLEFEDLVDLLFGELHGFAVLMAQPLKLRRDYTEDGA